MTNPHYISVHIFRLDFATNYEMKYFWIWKEINFLPVYVSTRFSCINCYLVNSIKMYVVINFVWFTWHWHVVSLIFNNFYSILYTKSIVLKQNITFLFKQQGHNLSILSLEASIQESIPHWKMVMLELAVFFYG